MPLASGNVPAADAAKATYSLSAEFQEPTKATVSVDEDFPEELNFAAGQSNTWHPKHSLLLTLPANAHVRLTLNGIILPLPAPVDGFITVAIPGNAVK